MYKSKEEGFLNPILVDSFFIEKHGKCLHKSPQQNVEKQGGRLLKCYFDENFLIEINMAIVFTIVQVISTECTKARNKAYLGENLKTRKLKSTW